MVFNALLRSLRGSNLEIFKFGLYLSFPIGWMYYFGTNLDERFSIPDFWPTAEQSHKLPYDKEDLKKEIQRMNAQIRERKRLEALTAGGNGGEVVGADGRAVLEQLRAQQQGRRGEEGRVVEGR